MTRISSLFEKIAHLTREEGQQDFISVLLLNQNQISKDSDKSNNAYTELEAILKKIINEVDNVAGEVQKDDSILISVKNQKLLRTCFQLITSLGISPSLIPGLGIDLAKRCSSSTVLPAIYLTDIQKYTLLVECTDFYTRSYNVPVLKSIIITLHLSDYLAALIQLSFAPLKKPGCYANFVMTEEMHKSLSRDKLKYEKTYEYLVTNCFQPILMKELLVLQSLKEPSPPVFAKRVITKELSRRLLAPGGLLSLTRCFIESYNIDTGFEWKKIEMLCKIVSAKHGNSSEVDYLENICLQLSKILVLNNTHYLATSAACALSLLENYPHSTSVKKLSEDIFQCFVYKKLSSNLPGTLILTPQEVEHGINILHACMYGTKIGLPAYLLSSNLHVLFLLGMRCTKNEELKIKLKDITFKCFEKLEKDDVFTELKNCLFGSQGHNVILVEEYEAGLSLKCVSTYEYPKEHAILYFLELFKAVASENFVKNVFEVSLQIVINLSKKRQDKIKNNMNFLGIEHDLELVDATDEQYGLILQLLSEISTSPKVISALKSNPEIVLHFIEYFLLKTNEVENECTTVALILLNTILSSSNNIKDLSKRISNMLPILRKMAANQAGFNNLLCKEALSMVTAEEPKLSTSACEKAINDTFDDLLPVRAHGIIKLAKLIDCKDAETLSKKHYVFCIFQEHLKDPDTYIYLAAINGIASLCTHCTDDVLNILCREFLELTLDKKEVDTVENQNKAGELRMKIGDTIVKVTKRLGEMAILHKTTLLNTILCGCRDEDPLIKTSALSNLAEIALVLHYRIGSIIYEVLLCVWSIIETDKVIECRRAAVMVISSLVKGLGKDTLIELKENLLPIYRTLKNLYNDANEDTIVRLHAQIALEELNDIVKQFLFPELRAEKSIFLLESETVFK